MVEVIGVRFRDTGKIYFFDPLKIEIEAGDHVIVETARGMEYGKVVYGRRSIDESKLSAPIKPIIRKATEADAVRDRKNKERCKEAFHICLEKIAKHHLEMKLIEAEYTFDRIWRLSLRQGSNCVRSGSGMRPRLWAALESVAESCAVIVIYRILHRYRSRWRRNRVFH